MAKFYRHFHNSTEKEETHPLRLPCIVFLSIHTQYLLALPKE